jgi:Fe-S oxidoreductase
MEALAPELERQTPIVVLEPSCASVFRDELTGLFPDDPRAQQLRSRTLLLSEFLERERPDYQSPRIEQPLLLHGHCHHKAIMKLTDEESILRRTGTDVRVLDAGCCGMAGPFGMLAGKYGVSQAIGERALLPTVRGAARDAVIVSDGFSCREQILQTTGRRALHLAEVLQPSNR